MEKHYPKNLGKWWRFWEREKIYKFNQETKKPIFSIDVPPITPSGEMHLGHLMHYTQFEFIARYKRMRGFEVFFPLCFDDNGLPTEKYVEDTLKISKAIVKKGKFQKLCFKMATQLNKEYTKLFSLIGFSGDPNIGYRTIDNLCQKEAQRSFRDLYKKGKTIRKEGPTIWCPFHQTALAQAEVDDLKRETYLNYLWFKLQNGEKILIATTRPELLSSCVGIFIHPEDKRYKNLIGKKAFVPIFKYEIPILSDEKVDPKFGSGIVMACTFGDKTDINWWKKYNLPLRISIEKEGKLNNLAKNYASLDIETARERISEDLKKKKILARKEKITQTIGVCWRCKRPLEYIVTKQWFIKALKYKKALIKLGRKLDWHPRFYRKRYEDWVKNLKEDWCISRQRYYGVPFPVWYCKKCQKVILAEDSRLPVNPEKELPKKACQCGSKEFIPESDVFDTWMTSSITPLINSRWKENQKFFKKTFPLDLRPQGHDIIRTWAFYTILKTWLHLKALPWKTIMIGGHALDPKGKKMSKSLGNIISAKEVLKNWPADAIRYWATKANLGKNLRFKEKEVKNGYRLMTKLWNAFRFSLPYLKRGINLDKSHLKLYPTDQWILSKLQGIIKNCTNFFEKYEFSKARKEIEDFFWNDFCDNYLELIKYRLYSKKENIAKKSAQFTLYKTFLTTLKLFAPFLPYLTEEIYQLYFRKSERIKSIHRASWPEVEKNLIKKELESNGEIMIELIGAIRKSKSEKNYSLKKEVQRLIIGCEKSMIKKIPLFLNDLKKMNNIKTVEFREKDEMENGILIRDNLRITIKF